MGNLWLDDQLVHNCSSCLGRLYRAGYQLLVVYGCQLPWVLLVKVDELVLLELVNMDERECLG